MPLRFRPWLEILEDRTAPSVAPILVEAPSSSMSAVHVLTDQASTTTIASSLNPSVVGQAVVFTAAVAASSPGGGIPTGTVTFTIDGTAQAPVALSSGVATFTSSSLALGMHSVSAAYSGNATFGASASGTLNQAVTSTDAVVLAALTSNTPNIALPSGVEVPVRQLNVYAPGSPNFNANLAVRQPVLPTPYTYWEVELLAAPITVQNVGTTTGTLLVNIYSSNAYVYQQEVTIAPGSLFPVTFGAEALGTVSNTAGAPPMPISVTMRAIGANMEAIMDPQGPADLRPGASYPSVAGFGVQLLPMDTGTATTPAGTTNAVVLAGLTAATPNIALPSGVEVPVRQLNVYAPGNPNFNANLAVRQPVLPTPYTYWEVELLVAPITVQNLSATSGTLVINIYSDNVYVYQQEVTIPADSLFPIYFGDQALGYISNTPTSSPMPISVTMQALGANMQAVMDTQGPADLRPNEPAYSRVAGMAVQLLPEDGGTAGARLRRATRSCWQG